VIGKGFNAWGGCSATDKSLGNIAEEIRDPKHHGNPNIPEVDAEQTAKRTEIFFSFYFAMTGLHAFHMVIGLDYWPGSPCGPEVESLALPTTRRLSWAACTGTLLISYGFSCSRCST